MSDQRERELERRSEAGDDAAREALRAARCRRGVHAWKEIPWSMTRVPDEWRSIGEYLHANEADGVRRTIRSYVSASGSMAPVVVEVTLGQLRCPCGVWVLAEVRAQEWIAGAADLAVAEALAFVERVNREDPPTQVIDCSA